MFSTKQKYSFSFPTDIRFGVDTKNDVPEVLKKQALYRPLIVTDKGLSQHSMILDLERLLSKNALAPSIFSDFSGNPTQNHVRLGTQAFHLQKADCIIAIGGGAALDVAKAIALMSCHEGDILEYAEGHPNKSSVRPPLPFIVAIPTTSGTGSEVGRSTVISENGTHLKKVIFHPSMLAKLVIIDPALTLHMPPSITAATGMDALSHLLESFLAKDFHPICDAISLHGLSLIDAHLSHCYHIARAVDETDNSLVSRGYMMLAATMGAIAFQKGLGVTHSCAHALSTVCNTHHGLANGVMLPSAMSFNAKACPQKFSQIASALHLAKDSPASVIDWIKELQRQIDIPQSLSAIGVNISQLNQLVEVAISDSCHENNPVSVTRDDFFHIFEAAFN